MAVRPVHQRANGGLCKVCGALRPPGRVVYCSDVCTSAGYVQRTKERQERRMAPCKRCGGQKDHGIRGGRFCAECKLLHADTTTQLEHERGRRRSRREVEAKLATGTRVSRRSDAPDGQKWCARCQDFRPLTSFPSRSGSGTTSYCRPCQRFYNSERRIKLIYGITWDEYELLLACQDDRCAICGGRPRKNLLAVDHDHKTGEIRGLLCSRCNHKLLGAANDDPVRLRKAADYLEQYAPREVFGDPKYVPGFTPPLAPLTATETP